MDCGAMIVQLKGAILQKIVCHVEMALAVWIPKINQSVRIVVNAIITNFLRHGSKTACKKNAHEDETAYAFRHLHNGKKFTFSLPV
jgi:hypothetical protein